MTSDPTEYNGIIEAAIAGVANAHLFFEDRLDVRATFSSSGVREVLETRTSGAAISGVHSVQVSDPGILDSRCGAMGEPALWVPRLEAAIFEGGARASAGRRSAAWSARIMSFHQEVWVGSPGDASDHDVRRGCRVEFRAQVGGGRYGSAVTDIVVRAEGLPSFTELFARAFDRAEQRAGRLSTMSGPATAAVLGPGVAGIVAHELIGHALEGDVLARGNTWVGSDTIPLARVPVTVIDDPRRGRGAWMIDDEGVAARETVLIDRGRRVGMLLDRTSAKVFGLTSTGHGRRSSYLDSVRSRMGCTFIAAGVDEPEDILRSTRQGVFIRRLAGGHTYPASGRATFVVSDSDRIVAGRMEEPLEPFVMELEGVESWGSIDRVGHDLAFDTCVGSCVRDGQPMAVSVGAPTIRIGVVRVHS